VEGERPRPADGRGFHGNDGKSQTKKAIQSAMTAASDPIKTVTIMGAKVRLPQHPELVILSWSEAVHNDERKVARLAVSHAQHPRTLRSLPNLRAGIAMIGMKMGPGLWGGECGG
jgi:hypothetical protein